jgi:spore germination protein KC
VKRICIVITYIFILLTLTGCWSKRELTELAITTAIGIDKIEDGYLISAQIINPAEIAGNNISSRTAVSTYLMDGKSISEAFRKMTTVAPRKMYLSHVRVVVIGEELAREGITQVLDFISRNHETRTDFYIVVSKGQKAHEILSILTPIEKIPANKIFGSIQISEELWAPTKGIHLDNLISKIISEGNNPVLTGVTVKGALEVEQVPSPTFLKLENLSIFKGDKLVGWMNIDEGKGFNYIEDNIKETVAVIPCEEDDGHITVELYNSKTNVSTTIKDGNPKIFMKVTSDVTVEEVSKCERKLTEDETFTWIEEQINDLKEKKILAAINKAKEHKTDIFGFGEIVNRKDPRAWETMKDTWDDEIFPQIEVDVKFETTIRRLGTITDSFQDKGKD